MQEVELQQLGPYKLTELLRTSFYEHLLPEQATQERLSTEEVEHSSSYYGDERSLSGPRKTIKEAQEP